MSEILKIQVPSREHANLDSLPLRFGLHFERDTEVEIYNFKDLGADDRYSDRHHYEGFIRTPSTPDQEGQFGHFVIGYRQRGNYWALVTAWRNSSQDDEYFLSNTMRNLREDGILNPSKLLRMHPNYVNGEINTSASLIKFLSLNLAQDEIDKAKASEERARIDTDKALSEIRLAREEAELAKRSAEHARTVAIEAIEAIESLEVRASKAEQAEQEARAQLAEALAQIHKNESLLPSGQPSNAIPQRIPARAVTAVWLSKTGSDYRNVGLEATVLKVEKSGQKIDMTYLDKDGVEKSIQDFGYQGFVEQVFNYLKDRQGKRAVFLITQRPGKEVKLTSDTMLLPAYKGLWA